MIRRPPRSTRTSTLFPYTTLFRSLTLNLGPEGTRVNAISAGPIKTLAASGVGNFRKMLSTFEAAAPLRRNVTIEDVGNAAAFMCSDLAAGITGEVTYVDAGYSTVGMPGIDYIHPSTRTATRKIGRAHVCTQINNAHIRSRLLLEK